MLKFLTGAAVFALAASAAMADPGGGKGGGGGGGGHGGGGDAGGKPQAQTEGGREHGNGGGNPHGEQRGDGGFDKHAMQAQRGDNGKSGDRGGQGGQRSAAPDRNFRQPTLTQRHGGDSRGEKGDAVAARRGDGDDRQNSRIRGAAERTSGWRWASSIPQLSRGLIAGCPPGLAKKDNGCLPPGLARSGSSPVFYDNPTWWNFNDRWHDAAAWNGGDYRYYDGYLVRSGGNGSIASWLPLLGGALSPGNLWPSQYASSPLPPYYQDYYGLGSPDGYRYYDDTLYRVDPQSQAITAITALLTGDSFQTGQRLPAGYDVYNIPYSYRDQYADGPDAKYRYSDGSIYEVDPTTQLVKAVIEFVT